MAMNRRDFFGAAAALPALATADYSPAPNEIECINPVRGAYISCPCDHRAVMEVMCGWAMYEGSWQQEGKMRWLGLHVGATDSQDEALRWLAGDPLDTIKHLKLARKR